MPEELPKLPLATRQPGGIFILKGAKLGVPEGSFQISISETGKLKVEIDFHIGLDMTDRWLAIAEINQTKAIEAAGQLDLEWPSGNDEAAVPHLESEFFYSIQCVCASAFAIDAFYASVQEHIDIPPELRDAWKKNRTSRPARISDVLRRGFVFGEATSQKIRSALDEIFSLRDKAVHPSPEMSKPLYHPRLSIGMPWHFVWFREENARNCYSLALSLIYQLLLKPKSENKALAEYCANAKVRLEPFVTTWESKHGALFGRDPSTSA